MVAGRDRGRLSDIVKLVFNEDIFEVVEHRITYEKIVSDLLRVQHNRIMGKQRTSDCRYLRYLH